MAYGVALETFFYGHSPTECPSIEQAVRALLDRSLGVEVWPVRGPHDKDGITSYQADQVRDICRNAPFVSMHSRYSLWKWNPTLLMNEIELCSRLGSDRLVIHRETLGLNRAGDSILKDEVANIARYAKDRNVLLLMENTPNGMWALDEVLTRLGENPDDTNMGICIDVGHAHISSDAGKQPIREYFKRYSSQLRHVHFSDNNGEEDSHLPPGKGTIQWKDVFACLADIGYTKSCVLEIHPNGDTGQAIDETVAFLRASEAGVHFGEA